MNAALDYAFHHAIGAGEAYGLRLVQLARPEFTSSVCCMRLIRAQRP